MLTTDGHLLEPFDDRRLRYRLDGREVVDGDVLEVLTDTGWSSGHYTTCVHPDTGAFTFEMHVLRIDLTHEHVTVNLPPAALFRWPTSLFGLPRSVGVSN